MEETYPKHFDFSLIKVFENLFEIYELVKSAIFTTRLMLFGNKASGNFQPLRQEPV